LARISIIDPHAYQYFEDWEYRCLRTRLVGEAPRTEPEALDRLFAITARTAVVLGTGPSGSSFDEPAERWDLRIICNSAVQNQSLLERLRPNVIAFADGVFHFGPSRYARAFRDDLMRAVDLLDPVLVVPNNYLGLLLANLPELSCRAVGLDTDAAEWTIPSRGRTCVKETGNVLTLLMLPVAAGLAIQVDVAGCDGRNPDETYFWKHGASIQYSDELMKSAFEAHPAFFRDQVYVDYYDRHCADLAGLLAVVEKSGVAVRSITRSYIPTLARRAR
jgi:hypothetical protein